jgi:general secretion pathway protein G
MKRNRQNREQRIAGFTLVEVMIVLFILVTLAAMAIVVVRGTQAAAQRDAAFTYVKFLEGAVERYAIHMGRPPTTEEGLAALVTNPTESASWAGPYIRDNATNIDPWGNEYQYASPGPRTGREFEIWSFGPDGIDNTEDDIGSWMPR